MLTPKFATPTNYEAQFTYCANSDNSEKINPEPK